MVRTCNLFVKAQLFEMTNLEHKLHDIKYDYSKLIPQWKVKEKE